MINKSKLVDLLYAIHGKKEALHAHELARKLGGNERSVRAAIASIFDRDDAPFLLGRASGGGFYRITDFEQAAALVAWFDGMAETWCRKADAIRSACARHGLYMAGTIEPRKPRARIGALAVVVGRLEKKQQEAELSDRQFTKKIGIGRSTWALLRAGKYKSTGGRDLVNRLTKVLNNL